MVFGEKPYKRIKVGATMLKANRIMKENNCAPKSRLHVMILLVRSFFAFMIAGKPSDRLV